MSEKEEIISIVDILAKLQPGNTFSVSSRQIVVHDSWSTAISRRYYSEDRHQTVEYCRQILFRSLDLLLNVPDEVKEELRIKILAGCSGFSSLRSTYSSDAKTTGSIDEIVSYVQKQLEIPKTIVRLSLNREKEERWPTPPCPETFTTGIFESPNPVSSTEPISTSLTSSDTIGDLNYRYSLLLPRLMADHPDKWVMLVAGQKDYYIFDTLAKMRQASINREDLLLLQKIPSWKETIIDKKVKKGLRQRTPPSQ